MRKILVAMCALSLALGAKAQKVVEDDVNRTETTTTDTSHGTDSEVNYMNSGTNIEYYGIDGGFGMGFDCIFNYLMFTGSFRSGETNSIVTENSAWSAGIGGHNRYWIGKRFYIEGNAGVEYVHATMKTKVYTKKYETEKASDGDFALFLHPHIGLRLFKLFGAECGITAGYRWEFVKFKFSKEYTNDFFTVGIATVF